MKILNKRIMALLLDSFILGILYVLIQKSLVLCGIGLNYWYILIFVLFFLKDFAFRNKSIGKKLLGIEIYDQNWEIPKFSLIVKRTIFMLTAGYILFLKIIFISGNKMEIFDWEEEKFGTKVIDKKILRELKNKTQNSSLEMTKEYNLYLISIYAK
ncbi:MAG: RDD family protein [Clostridia bacterium]|nr:RDD family protein [Clostridia bacterium]